MAENWREQRSSKKNQYAWFVAVFLHTATPWFVDTCEVSSVSNSRKIVAEAEGPDQERKWGGENEAAGFGGPLEMGVWG